MTMSITETLKDATNDQIITATRWTADDLGVPDYHISPVLAVAYVRRHYRSGDLTGWDGFTRNLGA